MTTNLSCRFCDQVLTDNNTTSKYKNPNKKILKKKWSDTLINVCNQEECLDKRELSCSKTNSCGHSCGGICQDKRPKKFLKWFRDNTNQTCLECLTCSGKGKDTCVICYVEELSKAPCIQLKCGHIFHYQCILNQLTHKWVGNRISFNFMCCSLCKEQIDHNSLKNEMKPVLSLYQEIQTKSLQQLKTDQLDQEEVIINKDGEYYQKPHLYALKIYAYYLCFKCQRPYYGGKHNCGDDLNDDLKLKDHKCNTCKQVKCQKQGHNEYQMYKCRYCCNLATCFCFGTTHYCESCHNNYNNLYLLNNLPKCPGLDQCPLMISHPPNGNEFYIGCAKCDLNIKIK